MGSPRPVVLTAVESNPDGHSPEPLVIVGDVPAAAVPVATTTTFGAVKKTPVIADLAADADLPTTVAKVNALLAALRTAGIVSAS